MRFDTVDLGGHAGRGDLGLLQPSSTSKFQMQRFNRTQTLRPLEFGIG
jgi:hypothetical protein